MMKHWALIASSAILVAMIAIAAIYIAPTLSGGTIAYSEAPLYKNSYLKLIPGQTFKYDLTMGNQTVNATYNIGEGEGCTVVRQMESVNFSGACLDRAGMDEKGFNTSVGSPPLLMFSPWMLALKEGWAWNSTMYLVVGGAPKRISQTDYRVVRLENLSGRQAFVVELRSDDQQPDYEWVDAQERILLKMTGADYTLELEDIGNLSAQQQ